MRGYPTQAQVERIKLQYPVGTRLELLSMSDPYSPVPPGTQGEVTSVDDMGTLHMKWDNGRSLGVVVGEDSFKVISKPQEEQIMDSPKMEGMSL